MADYKKLKVQELRDLCKEKGVDDTGVKAVLVDRLEALDAAAPGEQAEEEEAPAAEVRCSGRGGGASGAGRLQRGEPLWAGCAGVLRRRLLAVEQRQQGGGLSPCEGAQASYRRLLRPWPPPLLRRSPRLSRPPRSLPPSRCPRRRRRLRA